MRVWTNGSFARLWVKDKIFQLREGEVSLEEKIKAFKGARLAAPDEVVAWAPTGARLDKGLEKKRRRIVDARALEEGKIAGVIKEGRGAPRLVVGPPAGPFELEIALTLDGERADWPADVVFGESPTWSDSEMFVGDPVRGIRVHTNGTGLGIAAAKSGHVVVFRPVSEEEPTQFEAPSFHFRVPADEAARMDAVPTRDGVLLTVVKDGGEGAVVHFDPNGQVLGRWPANGSKLGFPALCLDDERALAFDASASELALLALPDLDELAKESINEGLVDAAATSKGDTIVAADPEVAYEIHVEGDGLSVDGPFELKATEVELNKNRKVYKAALASGPTQIAFPTEKQKPDPPWSVGTNEELKITMRIRSAGGAGHGVRVELGGEAIEEGLVGGHAMKVAGQLADFTEVDGTVSAVLPDIELPVGLAWPLDPKPKNDDEKAHAKILVAETHLTLEVVIAGKAPGNGLLSVAVGACDTTAAPLKRMRPITVHE